MAASRQPDTFQQHHRTALRAGRLQGCRHFAGGAPGLLFERDLLLRVEVAFKDVEQDELPNMQIDTALASAVNGVCSIGCSIWPGGRASIRASARRTRCSGVAPTKVARNVKIGRKW
ncbi:MAG: hypothetical protein V5B38_12625 [Candidatus Accumulibacter propinquus]